MKSTNLLVISFCILVFSQSNAQFVTIPDTNFVTKLQQLVPGAMNGNQMDTTHVQITTCTSLDVSFSSIQDLYGIQFFDSLETLNCSTNQLYSLPDLPSLLTVLNCVNNYLNNLQELPPGLVELNCSHNYLSNLPALPDGLLTLICISNLINTFPTLPETLREINCSMNYLLSLPTFPDSLQTLNASYCQLNTIATLPAALIELDVHENSLTSLPTLPATLEFIDCSSNFLTFLPDLPQSLHTLWCDFNQLSCLPLLPSNLQEASFSIQLNSITCIPNETPYINQATTGLPVCQPYDPVTNPNGCGLFMSVSGNSYHDENADCAEDINELPSAHIPILLINNITGDTLTRTYSTSVGAYHFMDLDGDYTVSIDTSEISNVLTSSCPDTSFLITIGQLIPELDLGVHCNGGYDIGVQSVVEENIVFPGEDHTLRVIAGDLSSWYGMHCGTSGISGQVQVTVTGPVSYNGTPLTALTPTINGNVYTYDIADFSTVDIVESFALNFTTDTTAQSGDTVSVYVTVTTSQPGDGDLSNNTFSHSYLVVNSYDPNMKEVYPVDVLPGYDDYFTYTIHFQNMGSAPAITIRLADTLDSHFDLSTFEVLSFSHDNEIHLTGNNLMVRFPNINLVSNTVDEEASKGYIQYRVKPYPNQPNGTVIPNTAYIYFDYNPAVITNTTENHFWEDLAVNKLEEQPVFYLYPNPNNGKFTILTEQEHLGSVLRVVDISGKIVLQTPLTTTTQSITSELDGGVYLVTLENPLSGTIAQKRLVISR